MRNWITLSKNTPFISRMEKLKPVKGKGPAEESQCLHMVTPATLGFPGRGFQSPLSIAPSSELLDLSLGQDLCPEGTLPLYPSGRLITNDTIQGQPG